MSFLSVLVLLLDPPPNYLLNNKIPRKNKRYTDSNKITTRSIISCLLSVNGLKFYLNELIFVSCVIKKGIKKKKQFQNRTPPPKKTLNDVTNQKRFISFSFQEIICSVFFFSPLVHKTDLSFDPLFHRVFEENFFFFHFKISKDQKKKKKKKGKTIFCFCF